MEVAAMIQLRDGCGSLGALGGIHHQTVGDFQIQFLIWRGGVDWKINDAMRDMDSR